MTAHVNNILRLAVVGHTNTGKTSLLRTLLRDADFGEVSNRPAVTRHVEAAALLVDGEPLVELYDTPGLEDSIGLLETLEVQTDSAVDVDTVRALLDSDAGRTRFSQESKALRQLLQSDAALYVVDARDRVLEKHRDELDILSRCARPIVPVLNFIAAADARTKEWRDALSRLNLHAVAEFDTVAYSADDEVRLFEKIKTLLDRHRATLDRLIEDRRSARTRLIDASLEAIAELLIDAAAYAERVPVPDEKNEAEIRVALEPFRDRIRKREQRAIEELLRLHRFDRDDLAPEDDAQIADFSDGEWGVDLFNPEALKKFGVTTGSSAAAGAAAGLAVDVMFGGLSLGAATALGAGVGALIGAGSTHGRRLLDAMRGYTELRCNDVTLKLLAAREMHLHHALLSRGHASQTPIASAAAGGADKKKDETLDADAMKLLRKARAHPDWSQMSRESGAGFDRHSGDRRAAITELAGLLRRTPPGYTPRSQGD